MCSMLYCGRATTGMATVPLAKVAAAFLFSLPNLRRLKRSMDLCYTSAAHGLHTEAPSNEIVAAMEQLKRQRSAVEDKRLQLAQSLERDENSQSASQQAAKTPSEFARLFHDNVVPSPTT
ncbi:unnamed protein product [Aphanomyces euteiches]